MSKYEITTGLYGDELYNLIDAIDYMLALKLLHDGGYDISEMSTFYYDQSNIDHYLEILRLLDSEIKEVDEYYTYLITKKTDEDKADKIKQLFIETGLGQIFDINYDALSKTLNIEIAMEELSCCSPVMNNLAELVIKANKILEGLNESSADDK